MKVMFLEHKKINIEDYEDNEDNQIQLVLDP